MKTQRGLAGLPMAYLQAEHRPVSCREWQDAHEGCAGDTAAGVCADSLTC